MRKSKIIIALVFIAILLVILIQNTQVVTLQLLFWEISMSQILLTSFTLLIGLVSGYIVAKVLGTRRRNT